MILLLNFDNWMCQSCNFTTLCNWWWFRLCGNHIYRLINEKN